MNPFTLYRELTAVGLMIASYPLDWIAERMQSLVGRPLRDPVVLTHGFGGDRTNLLALAAYLRMKGFENLSYFEYPRRQSIDESAEQLAAMVSRLGGGTGVHLIGHSMGGLIARRVAADAGSETVRSLITLSSPYSHNQKSPMEVALFGDEDPIVPPPRDRLLRYDAFKRVVVLPNTGHLGVLYHYETMQVADTEMRANAAPAN